MTWKLFQLTFKPLEEANQKQYKTEVPHTQQFQFSFLSIFLIQISAA